MTIIAIYQEFDAVVVHVEGVEHVKTLLRDNPGAEAKTLDLLRFEIRIPRELKPENLVGRYPR